MERSLNKKIYRQLQRHLDRQPVGFPAVRSGADLRVLERLFTEDEARLALHLTYRPVSTLNVVKKVQSHFPGVDLGCMLEEMFMKGSIARKERDNEVFWSLMPLVVGMYESQDGRPSIKFLKDAGAYMNTLAYGKSLLSAKPSQMRTIPINKSIPAGHYVAPYDEVRSIIGSAAGPFVVLPCICRKGAKLRRKPCVKTSREETCMAFGSMADMVLRRKHGREISREEAVAIAARNEEDGLVFQPSGVKSPEFVCSCCGCCCGMLGMQKKLPHPVDFWTSSFYVQVSGEKCAGCGKCVERCQVDAISIPGRKQSAVVNLSRCIGCGLCVSTCSPGALRLVEKREKSPLPEDEEGLFEEIMKNKKNILSEWLMMLKVMLGMRQ